MKYLLFLFLLILQYIKSNEEIFLDYYINYTFISPSSTEVQTYYFHPNYEVGTIYFIIYFSETKLSCKFFVYYGDIEIDNFHTFYGKNLSHYLAIPSIFPKPKVLRLEVTNLKYNLPYYLYFYNTNYSIPLIESNYYFYQLSLNGLEINYDIPNLNKDIYLKFQSKIEYPELDYNIHVKLNDGEKEYIFKEKTSYYAMYLKKGNNYKLNLKCNLNDKFTNKTMILIYLEEKEDNTTTLFYQENNIISYKSIMDINKIYFIDSINLIDGYNKYNFNLTELSEKTNLKDLKINVYIKKYTTNNLVYIKENIPSSYNQYDESFSYINNNIIYIKACSDHTLNDRAILIYIEINYIYEKFPLYELSIKKLIDQKPLEFKNYIINWYTKYNFSPLTVNYNDIIFISTNNSKTVYTLATDNARSFQTFYQGYLFVSYFPLIQEYTKVLIKYDDQKSYEKSNNIGCLQIFKFENEKSTFEIMDIYDNSVTGVYSYEIKLGLDRYFYIIMHEYNKNQYYLFNEQMDEYSYITIEDMPINIIDFSLKNNNDEIRLLNNTNSYIFKLGYNKNIFNIVRFYFLTNENLTLQNSLVLSEGEIKIYSLPLNKTKINLDIKLLSDNLTKNSFINIKIPSKKIEKNLYIEYNGNKYLLNNSGINLFYIQDNSININILDIDDINNDKIPIFIKFPLYPYNMKLINENKKYKFNSGQIIIYKFDKDKKIKLNLISTSYSSKEKFFIYYYIDYISEDYLNNTDTDNLYLSPEIFTKKEFNTSEVDFEISTQLDLEYIKYSKNNNNKKVKQNLYLIFSFNNDVMINNESESDNSDNKFTNTIIIVISVIVSIILIILMIIFIYIYKKKKKKDIIIPLKEPEIPEYNDIITSGQDNNENNYNKPENYYTPNKNEFKTIGKGEGGYDDLINGSNDISVDTNSEQPAPLPQE